MPATRRRFLQTGASAAALAAAGAAGVAQAARPPKNVVLIVIDTLRTDFAYRDGAHTPNIDALRRQGVSFMNVFPEAMPTVPARNTIVSGRRQFPYRRWHRHAGLIDQPGWEPPDSLLDSLQTRLRAAGHWTAYATDNPFLGFAPAFRRFRLTFDAFARRAGQLSRERPEGEVDEARLQQWLHPAIENTNTRRRVNRFLVNGGYVEDERRSFAARVFTDGLRLLEGRPADRPFALILDTFQPHEPWTPPRAYSDLYYPGYSGREPSMPPYTRTSAYLAKDAAGRDFLRRMRALYAGEVTLTDHWLGVFLDGLRTLGLERDTAIVLTSDHGIYLGDRGWTGKISHALHPELIHVPLVVVDPRRRLAGTANPWLASTHDVAPTVMGLAGLRAPRWMEGADLSLPFRGKPLPKRSHAWGGYRNSFYIRSRRWALIGNNRGRPLRLFDLAADPDERVDVADKHRRRAEQLYGKVLRRAGGRRLPYYEPEEPPEPDDDADSAPGGDSASR